MLSRKSIAAIAALSLVISACGGGAESSSDTEFTPPAPLITRSTNDIAPTTVAVDNPAPTTSEAVEMTAPIETIALNADECPNGEWLIDPSGIGPFDLFGSSDDITLTGDGSFLATFADGRYTIATDDFSLDLLTPTSEIVVRSARRRPGSASGEAVCPPSPASCWRATRYPSQTSRVEKFADPATRRTLPDCIHAYSNGNTKATAADQYYMPSS